MLRLFRLLGCGSCLPCGSSSSSQFPEPVQSSFLPADQSAKRAGLKLGPQFPRLALNPRELGLRPGTKKKNRFLSSVGAGCHARCRSEEGAGRGQMPASLLRLLVPASFCCKHHSPHFLRRAPRQTRAPFSHISNTIKHISPGSGPGSTISTTRGHVSAPM